MPGFSTFVVFAEMRTGSNLLEAQLNALEGVQCLGELFNPHFIGGPNRDEVLGMTQSQREAAPEELLQRVRDVPGALAGFRLFHDHDARAIEAVIADPACAKIVLTRDPLDAYVSRKIAGKTGQWRLGDLKDRRSARIHFDEAEFEDYLAQRQAFQKHLRQRLNATGQAAFHVTYDDLGQVDTINGIAAYLGVSARLEALAGQFKKQNPESLEEKVENFAAMRSALAGFDWFDLEAAPHFEPHRRAKVPGFASAATSALVYLPISGAMDGPILSWMKSLDGAPPTLGHSQKSLRDWLKATPDRQVFTAISHPLDRAYCVFQSMAAEGGAQRQALQKRYGIPFATPSDGAQAVAAGFQKFLEFLAGNLAGQTSVRIEDSWASQTALLQAFGQVLPPDRVLRPGSIDAGLSDMAGAPHRLDLPAHDIPLGQIHTRDMDRAARRAYRRDFVTLGFEDWA